MDDWITTCDKCGEQVDIDDVEIPNSGKWKGDSLCHECYSEVIYDDYE